MLPIAKKVRPPKDPNAEKLYAETDTLKLPPAAETVHVKEQKEMTYALTRAHRKTGYPRLLGPVGVKKVPPYFIDRAKDIALKLKSYHNRHEKTRHYYDSCAHYDPQDPDLLYHQGVYHGQFNEYSKTLEKMEQCLQINPRDHRALLLKADTHFRMCDFETALLCYLQGINLRYPFKNWFLDGYYRTTALLYDLTCGEIPLYYGGNMKVFYRLVQGQERRPQRLFNDTYKHYDELYPLEPNLTGAQEEINMFHVSKPKPPNHVQRRIWIAAIQQLKGARKCLGSFYDCKVEIEKYLIKQEHFLPRFGRANQTEKIDRALKYLRARIDKFEVICTLMKSRQMRSNYGKPIDWLLEYGRWMAEKAVVSSIPPARVGGLQNSRYKWALSQTLFDIREKPLDVCWVRRHGRSTRSSHLLARRRPWKYMCGYKSAQKGALAALRSGGDEWPFMQKLKTRVWDELGQHAPPPGELKIPKHIREIKKQKDAYEKIRDDLEKASKLSMPPIPNENKGKLYYDPEVNEEQWDENREMVKNSILKRNKVPSLLPLPSEQRPIPANLLEVFETKVHEDVGAWDQRRKMSMELRETLAKAEAVKAAHAAHEKHGLFGPSKSSKKTVVKVKAKKESDTDVTEEDDNRPSVAEEPAVAAVPAVPGPNAAAGAAPVDGEVPADVAALADAAPKKVSMDDEFDEMKGSDLVEKKIKRPIRRPGERPRFDILNQKLNNEYQDRPRLKRRVPKRSDDDDRPVTVVMEERMKTPEELEAEKLLAARADDPVETARRIFDNQKAALLEKSYAVLMTCTKVSEFLEIELELGDLLDTTFPPKNMRFPNGDPIILSGYPAPVADFTRMIPSEIFANRKKRKRKFGGDRAVTAAEAQWEQDAVERLLAEKGRRQSVLQAANSTAYEEAAKPVAAAAAATDDPLTAKEPPPTEIPTEVPTEAGSTLVSTASAEAPATISAESGPVEETK
ncbi:hypothetical protein BV898_11713 [Hypsibius exemplaris]|uniref:Uncharacterized protein n=1 Tax=Hypsibius exemplaris TaxID=2072580 RepID=A0A1W0WFT1_HYPEX|nr:hypothetical protein BV898_11713 [Hypsibius exemplaris]